MNNQQQSVEVKVQIISLSAHYYAMLGSFMTSMPPQPPRPEINPDWIDMMFTYIHNNENRDRNGNIMIRKEHRTEMGVTVEDVMTLGLSSSPDKARLHRQ